MPGDRLLGRHLFKSKFLCASFSSDPTNPSFCLVWILFHDLLQRFLEGSPSLFLLFSGSMSLLMSLERVDNERISYMDSACFSLSKTSIQTRIDCYFVYHLREGGLLG